MFTWICPKCGREVPPAYDECPDCARAAQPQPQQPPARQEAPASEEERLRQWGVSPTDAEAREERLRQLGLGGSSQAEPYEPPYPNPQQVAQPPQAPPPPMFQHPQQPGIPAHHERPAPRGRMPVWLMTILFAFAFLGVGSGIYWLVGYLRSNPPQSPSAMVESPAAKSGGKTSPLQKYIEVTGVRFIEGARKRPEVRFVVVNHSPADIGGLAGNVTIWGRTQKSEEDAAGTFTFTTNLGPWESKDLTAPLNSKLKIYELPDWQNVSTDIQITAPAASLNSGAPR
jgi:hypothetical protein